MKLVKLSWKLKELPSPFSLVHVEVIFRVLGCSSDKDQFENCFWNDLK